MEAIAVDDIMAPADEPDELPDTLQRWEAIADHLLLTGQVGTWVELACAWHVLMRIPLERVEKVIDEKGDIRPVLAAILNGEAVASVSGGVALDTREALVRAGAAPGLLTNRLRLKN